MDFTGERFLPELHGEIAYEHWHRYAFARQWISGKKVLDIACGEGYGSALLAETASEVVGADINKETLTLAARTYHTRPNLHFIASSCDALSLTTASFDVVVSFETIEHIATQAGMLGEINRVLKPEGVLCISSPNKAQYSDERNYKNPFHVKELYQEELIDLLAPHFPATRWFAQKLLFHSAIWPQEDGSSSFQYLEGNGPNIESVAGLSLPAMYFVVVCAKTEDLLPQQTTTSFFSDRSETVYHAYDLAVRELVRLNGLLSEREKIIIERDQSLREYTAEIQTYLGLIAERDALLALRTSQMLECERIINERDQLLALRTQQMEEREKLIELRDQQLAMLRRSPLQKLKVWLK